MLAVTGIIKILTTSPIKDFIISYGASMGWDGTKKVASHFHKDSIDGQIWRLLSDTMAQFYEQIGYTFGTQLEFDERIVVTSFLEQLNLNKHSINENSLRYIIEETIYGGMNVLTDKEYKLWVSIFADNYSKYPNLYQMYNIQNNIMSNVFTERNLMLQKIDGELRKFVGNENHDEGLFQPIIDNLCSLFNTSWKSTILAWIDKLYKDFLIQQNINEKKDLINTNEDCELILSVLEELFILHDLKKSPYELVQKLKDFFRYPHFDKVFILTGTAGAGKSFFIKEFIETITMKIEKNEISILPCIVEISRINSFPNFEDFIINELYLFTGKKLASINDANTFFKELQSKICFIIDDVNSQILKKEDWNKLIQGIKIFSKFEQFRWILSIDEYEYYYLEWNESFLKKYCITQMSVTHRENISIFCNAFSIDQYNKREHIVEWILKSQYGMDEQLFLSSSFLGITTPKEAHYFGEAAPKGEVIGLPSTYDEYISKITDWKNTDLINQKPDGMEYDLRTITEFIISNHTCKLDGLNLEIIDLISLRKVQLVSPFFVKSNSMFDLDQGIIKTSYKINVLPFWAAKMTKMINVGDLISFPKELSEWLIPCVIFFNFKTYKNNGDELFVFFNALNTQHVLNYALFCANKTSIDFSKKLYEYLMKNMECYIEGSKECYSILYFVFYSQLKTAEKLQLLNAIAEFIIQYSFEKLYERIFCSIINTSKTEKNLKKNVLTVASCQVNTVNYINGSNAGSKYMELARKQEKKLETIVWDIITYIKLYPNLLSSISKRGNNNSFMDFFIRRCFEKYLFIEKDSLIHVYQRLETIFELEAPLGVYVKRNLTCAAGNVFVNSKDEVYKKNYILLTRYFAEMDDWYQRLTALFLITNSVDEKEPNLDNQLASILINLSHDEEIYSKHSVEIENLLKEK